MRRECRMQKAECRKKNVAFLPIGDQHRVGLGVCRVQRAVEDLMAFAFSAHATRMQNAEGRMQKEKRGLSADRRSAPRRPRRLPRSARGRGSDGFRVQCACDANAECRRQNAERKTWPFCRSEISTASASAFAAFSARSRI